MRPLVLLISLLGILCGVPGQRASAEDVQQNALARSLFEEGVALSDAGDYVGAADRFGRAYSLKPTSGIAFNWASVLAESGKLLQAQDLLLAVTRDPASDAQLKAAADTLLRSLLPRVPHLRLHVGGPVDETTSLQVDRAVWPRAVWDIASPLDPGSHEVVLLHGDAPVAQARVELGEGMSRDLSLDVPGGRDSKEQTALPLSLAGGPVMEHERSDRRLYKSWVVWTAVGAVVVGGVVAAVVLSTRREAGTEAPVQGNATPGVITW